MTGSGGTNTACAACKYQRRKCTPDCPLSPYFPPDQPKRFQNVHKLFGVSNILRILKHVDPSKREDTVKSIAYEADTREKDPVHGCLGVITILQNQVSKLKEELAMAREQLYLLQQQHNFNQQAQMQQIVAATLGGSTSVVNVSSGQDSSALMQHLQQYSDMNLSVDFSKNNPITSSCFEDQYLRHDSFDQQLKPASSGRFDMGRYIRGESPIHQQHSSVLLGHQVKAEIQAAAEQLRAGSTTTTNNNNMQHYHGSSDSGTTFIDTSGNHSHSLLQDSDQTVDAPDPYAMAMRRPAGGGSSSSGLLNLTVTSDAELRRANGHHHHHHHHQHGVPEHELRSAGVYLTLTNNH